MNFNFLNHWLCFEYNSRGEFQIQSDKINSNSPTVIMDMILLKTPQQTLYFGNSIRERLYYFGNIRELPTCRNQS